MIVGFWRDELYVGRRVWLLLPVGPNARSSLSRVGGTVATIDEDGLPPGVRVQLDREVVGADHCYATYGELHPER